MPRRSDILYLVHLQEPECSGRGIKLRRLGPRKVQEMQREALRSTRMDAGVVTTSEQANAAHNDGLALWREQYTLASIVEITVQEDIPRARDAQPDDELPACLGVRDTELTWHKVTLQELNTMGGDWDWNEVFTPKDWELILTSVGRWYEASNAEVQAIMGKALRTESGG